MYFIVLLNACDILAKNLNHLIFAIDFATHILLSHFQIIKNLFKSSQNITFEIWQILGRVCL
ncbi:hypothetical protein [Helicobacter sp. T3_23-1059]